MIFLSSFVRSSRRLSLTFSFVSLLCFALSLRGLGNEAIWVGNSRPSLWLLENIWERRDTLDAMEPGSGRDVDLFVVMRELGWELLLA